jgi:MFS family permease
MTQPADVRKRPASLFRQRNFALLCAGQSASVFGTEISFVAVPLTAVLVLDATPMEAGVLRALETLPFLLFGLFVGVFLDRRSRRSVMIAADVVRAAALAWIPIAYALDVLTIGQLFLVVFVLGVMSVFFDLAYQSYLPGLIGRDRLTEANGKLQLSASGAQVAGPGAAGLLIAWLGAPVSLAVDAMTYVLSFVTVARLPADQVVKAQPDVPAASVAASIRVGFSVIWRHPLLRWCTTAAVIINLFSAAVMSLFFLFLVQELGIGAAQIGLVVAAGSLGVLAGAMMVGRLSRWFGEGPAIIVSMALSALGYLVVALAPAKSPAAFAVAALGSFIALFGVPVFNVLVVSFRQISTPDELLGRANATARTCMWGAAAAGSLLGGALASVVGLREAVLMGAVGTFLSAFVLLFSPVRAVRRLHTTPAEPGPAAEPRSVPTDQEQSP